RAAAAISADAELVAFRVGHHDMVPGKLAQGGRSSLGEARDRSGDPVPAFIGGTGARDADIHVQPVLRDLRLRYLKQAQPWPSALGVAQPRRVVRVVVGIVELRHPLRARLERRRWWLVDVPQRQLPELRELGRLPTVEREIDAYGHASPYRPRDEVAVLL